MNIGHQLLLSQPFVSQTSKYVCHPKVNNFIHLPIIGVKYCPNGVPDYDGLESEEEANVAEGGEGG